MHLASALTFILNARFSVLEMSFVWARSKGTRVLVVVTSQLSVDAETFIAAKGCFMQQNRGFL